MRLSRKRRIGCALVLSLVLVAACGDDDDGAGDAGELTVYSGRNEALVASVLESFTDDTGIEVSVRYSDSASLAAQLLEEGSRSPADVFFSQDAGALGALDKQGLLAAAPQDALDAVDPRFRSKTGTWVGVSGRARVVVYNPGKVPDAELPGSVFDLTDPKWKGRVAVAPTNASFQSFVTAMRIQAGDDRTREWLKGIKANEPVTFPANIPLVEAVDEGEVDLGLANHYYLFERQAAIGKDKVVARNAYTAGGDPGALVNVAGAAVLKSSKAPDLAATFVRYLLSESAQTYFARTTYEYPLIEGVPLADGLTPLAEIQSPDIDLSDLDTLEQTLAMIREAGLL